MDTSVEIYWAEEPREESERQFLAQLTADLERRNISALILANFFTNSGSRQVDFLVVTPHHVCHVELKHYSGVLVGGLNGSWSSRREGGSLKPIDRSNPYAQAVGCKQAISDDMHALARRDGTVSQSTLTKFYTKIDTVICVFPQLSRGSQVPNDYKARTMGYTEFLEYLVAPGAHPAWGRDAWLAFVMDHGLSNMAGPSIRDLAVEDACGELEAYSRRLASHYRIGLHELVPLPLTHEGRRRDWTDLDGLLKTRHNVQVVGPSGSGKSHLVRHLALAKAEAGDLVLFVEAGMYEGRLSSLLNRSIARFTTHNLKQILQAAALNDRNVLLVVDGYNECPERLRDSLTGDISAFCLRHTARTLFTCQTEVPMPEPLTGASVTSGSLTDADRQAVLASYGSRQPISSYEPFRTAYELAIAAMCTAVLPQPATRADLFAAFIRTSLAIATSPATTRLVLQRLAVLMGERLTTWLPLDETWRAIERILAEQGAPAAVLDNVMNCSIIRIEQGRFSFTHELLGRFLTAEALLLKHAKPVQLAGELKKPRHADLIPFAVELERAPVQLEQMLARIADTNLYSLCLRGEAGEVAAHVAAAASTRLLKAVVDGLESTTFSLPAQYQVTVKGGRKLASTDRALLAAIGAQVVRGRFVSEVVAILDATDAACRRSSDEQVRREGRRPAAWHVVAAILMGQGNGSKAVAAAILLQACHGARFDLFDESDEGAADLVPTATVASVAEEATASSYGRLLLICSLLESINGLEAAALVPRVLQLCLDSNAYHVQLHGLEMAQSFVRATEDHPVRDEIVAILHAFETDNIALSSTCLEALHVYGEVESPYNQGMISEDIRRILEGPDSSEQRRRAQLIVNNQFEDVIGEPFYRAIEELTEDQRVDLYVLAAMVNDSLSLFRGAILRELVNSKSARALPAFYACVAYLDTGSHFPQGVGECYVLGILGCAQFVEAPPELLQCSSDDYTAWQCVGSIIFWMHRPGLDDAAVVERCQPLWERLQTDLLRSAVDALRRLSEGLNSARMDNGPEVRSIVRLFPAELRVIMYSALDNMDGLTSLFETHPYERHELALFVLNVLAYVGTADTADRLRSLVDDRKLGAAAIQAIRRIEREY